MGSEHDEATLGALAGRFERSVREIEVELREAVATAANPREAMVELRNRARAVRRKQHRLHSGRRVKFHGIGGRFVSTSGESVDLDWSTESDGGLVWDRWRLAEFARSVGEQLSEDQTEFTLERLLGAGATPASGRPGFFRLR